MLTEFEMKTMDFVYKTVCRYGTVPFIWNNGSMHLKSRETNPVKFLILALYFLGMIFKGFMLLQIIRIRDINSLIVYGIASIGYIAVGIFKLSLGLYKTELVEVISLERSINSSWGEVL